MSAATNQNRPVQHSARRKTTTHEHREAELEEFNQQSQRIAEQQYGNTA
jgi:hypothetical protein